MQTNPTEPLDEEIPVQLPALEQTEGNIFHDYIVPRYSLLASSPRKPIVVIGTWLLMLPTVLLSITVFVTNREDGPLIAKLGAIPLIIVTALSIAVVWKITRRGSRR